MKSEIFRALIQSLLAAAAPLALQTGCGTCTKTDTSPIEVSEALRLRVSPWDCEAFCGTGSMVCSVAVSGPSSLALHCEGQPAAMSLPGASTLSVIREDCPLLCGTQVLRCAVSNADTRYPGQIVRQCSSEYACPQSFGAVEGRRPAEVRFVPYAAEHEVGAFFAEAYQLEAAAVTAFSILAHELRVHGAPAELIAAAEQAERDEVRHTQMTAALAQRFAAEPQQPSVARHDPRPLLCIALENVVEGCVREAYGAFVASWQGTFAQDAHVRAIMSRIARDEIQHAELAFAIDAWIRPQLSEPEQALLLAARTDAVADLVRLHVERPLHPSLRTTAGLPEPAPTRAFLHAVAQGQI